MATRIVMPKLGESVVEGTIGRWVKQEGETIEEFETLLEVASDKVDTEVPSPASGTVLKIIVPEGETVPAGTTIAWIGEPGEDIPEEGGGADGQTAASPREAETAGGNGQPAAAPPRAGRDSDLGFISPVVARMAREENVDLTQIRGTGQGGRITRKDVRDYIEQRKRERMEERPAWETPGEGDLFRPTELQFGTASREAPPAQPEAAETPAREERPAAPAAGMAPGDRLVPHSRMRRSIAEHMVISKRTAPHVTTVMEADLQRVVRHREANKAAYERDGARLTYTPYFIAAAVAALKAYPQVNASWTEEGLLLHGEINVGIATSLGEEGLIVPVIHRADSYSLLGLARAVADLAGRARSRQLKPDEIKNGTFTITNHGTAGSLFATPVINQPQVGILGVGAIQKRPVVVDEDAIAVRPMVYLSLTFDHRALDGASADAFLSKVVETLENWS